jgi:hypothetical protein
VLLADLQSTLELLRTGDQDAAPASLGELFARELGLATPEAGVEPTWPRLFTEAGLKEIGLDPSSSAVIVPTVSDDAVVIGFGLTSRALFEAWLGRLAHGESKRVEIAGELASVFGPSREVPITCLSRQADAFCQIGISQGPDAVLALRTIVQRSSPTFDQAPGLLKARERLAEGAHAYGLVNGEALGRSLAGLALARVQRFHRFDGKDARKLVDQEAQLYANRIKRAFEGVDAAAFGLYTSKKDALALKSEIALNDHGAQRLRDLTERDPQRAGIERWSETPSLARILLRTTPASAQRILQGVGFSLPQGSLTGTSALLWFGIDTECPEAKKSLVQPGLGLAFLLPSALAVGIRSREAGPPVHDALQSALEARASGSAYDIRVMDDVVFVGTGPGSGAAAVRRMNGLAHTPDKEPSETPPFLEGSVHLRAVDAALESVDFGSERPHELLLFNAVRQRMRPLLEHAAALTFAMRTIESERRVQLDLEVQR